MDLKALAKSSKYGRNKHHWDRDTLVERMTIAHGNRYSLPEQELLANSKVKVICSLHGEFTKSAKSLINLHVKPCDKCKAEQSMTPAGRHLLNMRVKFGGEMPRRSRTEKPTPHSLECLTKKIRKSQHD